MATFNQAIVISVYENAGTFTAKAHRNGEDHLLAEASAGSRIAAVNGAITAMASTIYGDLTTLPLHVVDRTEVQLAS